MAYDAFGNFTRLMNWTQDKINAIKITSVRHDQEDDGFAAAFNQVLLRNGVAPLTGALKMGNNAITSLWAGTVLAPSIQFSTDLTTGFYMPGAATFAFTVSGVEVGRFSASGLGVTGNVGCTAHAIIGGFAMVGGILEDVNFSVTALTGVVNVDANNVGVFLYTANAIANWSFNFRGDAITTMNNTLLIGQSFSIAIEVPQGAAPFFCTAITVDGVAPTQVKWFGGAPTAGNATGIDVYAITVIKHGANDFYVRASLAQVK